MTRETDLPCAACGADLFENSVSAEEVPFATTRADVTVAECALCGARFYPEGALDAAQDQVVDNRPGGR